VTDIERLVNIEAIRQLKARYLRFADTKQWVHLSACFSEDVSCDWRGATTDPASGKHLLPGSDAIIAGRDNVMAIIIRSMSEIQSTHQVFMPEIEIISEDRASGIWAMADRLYIPSGNRELILQGHGHYHDTFQKYDGRWIITSLRLVRSRVEIASRV
jgi:hypothetical protein